MNNMLASIVLGLILQSLTHDLAWAAAKYQEFGLPVPPVGASLVVLKQREPFVLAYKLKDGIQFGTERITDWEEEVEPFEMSPDVVPDIALEGTVLTRSGAAVHQSELGFVVAVIEKLRGNTDFAGALMDRMGDRRLELGKGEVSQIESRLGAVARRYWVAQAIDPQSSRVEVSRHLHQIFEAIPSAETKNAREVAESLLLADADRYKGNDPVEKLIDTLCDLAIPPKFYTPYGRMEAEADGISPAGPFDKGTFLTLVSMGYKAIPNLIEHADDARATRTFKSWQAGYLDREGELYTVGAMCRTMLGHLQGRTSARDDSLATLRAWWTSLSVTEEEYCLDALSKRVDYPDSIIRICQARYPRALARAFKDTLGAGDQLTWKLTKALADPIVPRGIATTAFVEGCRDASYVARLLCMGKLQELDARKFDVELVKTYALLPTELPKDENEETIKGIINLSGKSTSSSPWEELTRAIRRANPEFRAWLLQNLEETDETQRNYRHLLLSFLDDRTPIKWSSPIMMVETHVIADIAADKASSSLRLPICKESTSRGWTLFRKEMRGRLLDSLNSGS